MITLQTRSIAVSNAALARAVNELKLRQDFCWGVKYAPAIISDFVFHQ